MLCEENKLEKRVRGRDWAIDGVYQNGGREVWSTSPFCRRANT